MIFRFKSKVNERKRGGHRQPFTTVKIESIKGLIMIQIELRKNREGLLTGYEVLGHAEDAPMGNSVLCAWVSAVTQMALIGLEQEIKHAVSYETDETKGLLKVRLKGYSRQQDSGYPGNYGADLTASCRSPS
jgi:uncharacterized protein YsxB (DUF464 family)